MIQWHYNLFVNILCSECYVNDTNSIESQTVYPNSIIFTFMLE